MRQHFLRTYHLSLSGLMGNRPRFSCHHLCLELLGELSQPRMLGASIFPLLLYGQRMSQQNVASSVSIQSVYCCEYGWRFEASEGSKEALYFLPIRPSGIITFSYRY